jgi:type IV pilus assembly protein PilC
LAKYIYKAVSLDGKNVQGVIEAETTENFKAQLKQTGLFCLSYSLEEEEAAAASAGKIPLKELSVMCRQFSAMLNAGISVVKCLDVLCQQTSNAKVKNILEAVMQDVRKGFSLHQAMSNQGQAFPFYLVSSIESGEESGTLDSVMKRMSDYFEKQYKTAAKIRSALTYPIILAILCVIVVFAMLTFVVPKFLAMYSSQGDLPGPTKVLIGISDFMVDYWWVVVFAIAGVIALIFLLKKAPSTRTAWDTGMLKMPVIGKMRKTVLTAKFAHTLSTLTSSGISMLVALEVVSRVIGNWCITSCISVIIDDLKKGVSLSQSLRKFDVFPPMFKSMVAVGEESGQIDDLLEKTASYYDDEADIAIQRMVSMVEPLMIVVMAVVIGFIVIAMIMPIYTMYQNMLG